MALLPLEKRMAYACWGDAPLLPTFGRPPAGHGVQGAEDDVIGVGDVPPVGRLEVGVGDAVEHGEVGQGGRRAGVADLGGVDGDRLAVAKGGLLQP